MPGMLSSVEYISGTNPVEDQGIQFSLVPRKATPGLYGNVPELQSRLAELQQEYPFLRASSPLEDMARLLTLRNRSLKLEDTGTQPLTFSRNFMMPLQRAQGTDQVIQSWVDFNGRLYLGSSHVDSPSDGRAVIG